MPIVTGRSKFAQVPDSSRMAQQQAAPAMQGDGFDDNEGFFIRSLWGGPLIISDPGQDGLYVEMVPNEVMDLSHEDVSVLKRSPALRRAMHYGWIERITREQYDYLFEYQTQMQQYMEIQRQQEMLKVEGAMLDDYNIDLGREAAGRAHHYSGGFGYTYNPYAQQQPQQQQQGMSLAAMQMNQMNNPYFYSQNMNAMRQQGVDPMAFGQMVNNGEIMTNGMSRRGIRVPMMQPGMMQTAGMPQPMDQISMTSSAATYGVPNGMGGVATNQAPMGNFNFQAQIPGAMGNQFSARDQAPANAFPRPGMPQGFQQPMPQMPGMMPQMPMMPQQGMMPGMMPNMMQPGMMPQMGFQRPMAGVAPGQIPTEEINLAEDERDYDMRRESPYGG